MLEWFVIAQQPAQTPQGWWTPVTGIIGIPVAIVGLVVSILLVKKTRLESRKFELEILEKERAIAGAQAEGNSAKISELVAQPILESRRVQEILLHAIVLFFALQAWSLVQALFNGIRAGAGLGLTTIFESGPGTTTLEKVSVVTYIALGQVPAVGYWLLFIALGGPLLADILGQLNIASPKILERLQRPTLATYIVIGVIVFVAGIFSTLGRNLP